MYALKKRTDSFEMAPGNVPLSIIEEEGVFEDCSDAVEYLRDVYGESPIPTDIFFLEHVQ